MYKEIITKSLKDVFENYDAILKALIIPVILLFLIEYVSNEFTKPNEFGVFSIVLVILSLLVDMIILISVHRILILGRDSVPTWGIRSYTKREYKFVLKYLGMIGIVVLCLVPTILIFSQSPIFYMVALFVLTLVLIIISRISLVFPAISIDEDMSFKESWALTKNYKMLSFTTIIIFPLLFSIIVGGIYTLVIKFLAATISTDLNILLVLLNIAITVFLVSALSNTYMYIIYHTENGIYDEDQSDSIDD